MMEVAVGHSRPVDDHQERQKAIKKGCGYFTSAEAGEFFSFHPADGESVGVDSASEARDPRDAGEAGVGSTLPTHEEPPYRVPDPEGPWCIVLDDQTESILLPKEEISLGPVPAGAKGNPRRGPESLTAWRSYHAYSLYVTMKEPDAVARIAH